MAYSADAPRIPAAAISAEDADLIQRLVDAGEEVRRRTQDDLPSRHRTRSSRNVLTELTGRELPEEIVLIGAHISTPGMSAPGRSTTEQAARP